MQFAQCCSIVDCGRRALGGFDEAELSVLRLMHMALNVGLMLRRSTRSDPLQPFFKHYGLRQAQDFHFPEIGFEL